MLNEAAKPNLDLIEQAREEEQRRQTVCEKGMPIFFQTFGQTAELQTAIQSINSNSQTFSQTKILDKKTNRQTTNTIDQTTSISNDNRPSKKTNERTITKQASDKQTLNQTTEKTNLNSKRSNKQPTNITELFELANKIKQQTGKYPSIRKFAAAAGITNYQSMKILDKLKKSG